MVKFWPKFWPSFALFLGPENFSKELVLDFNLGPLKDGLIDEVLALDSAKSYLRK